MAYSDTRGLSRLNPASIGAALAINSLMLAGFVMLKPDVLPRDVWTTLGTYAVDPDSVKPPEADPVKDPPKGEAALTPVPRTPATPRQETTFMLPPLGDEFGKVGGIGPVIEDPPIKIEPVFKNARVDPRYAKALQPSYPPGMIHNEIEGSVTVRVLVGADGRVKAVEPVRSDEAAFLEATRKQALSKWRFLPATRDGEPVESWREMSVRFVLPD